MIVDWQVIEEAIKRANKLGQKGVRILKVEYAIGNATSRDNVIFNVDNGPKSATEIW